MTGFGWQPLLSFAISLIGSGLTLVYAKRAGIIDVPNLRSSHKIPTPRGGGIALVAAVAISFALSPRDGAPRYALIFLGCALLALAIVGWLDDMRGMPVARRLPVHILCGIAAALVVQNISPMEGMANILWLGWWIFWTTASVNIVNFMDGIDGMITCQGIIYGAFLFALLPSGSAGAQFGLLLAAACLGFLFWNRPPAKMFMGDVGSGPLGLFFVVGAALSLRDARTPLIFLPLFPLYLDALVTLVRRYGRGEKLTAAHREHLYQRIVGGGSTHRLVTLTYALLAILGAAVSILLLNATTTVMWTGIAVYLAAVCMTWLAADRRYRGDAAGVPSTSADTGPSTTR